MDFGGLDEERRVDGRVRDGMVGGMMESLLGSNGEDVCWEAVGLVKV